MMTGKDTVSMKNLSQVKLSDVTLIATEKLSPHSTTINTHHLIAKEAPCSFINFREARGCF